jgi:hypothetical protein
MTLADAFAVGSEIKGPDGTTYTLRKLTLIEQGQFQRWLEKRAHDAVDRGAESEFLKERRHDRIYADSAIGKYEWDGPLAIEAMWTPAGLTKIIYMVCHDQGVDEPLAEKLAIEQIKHIAAVLLGRAGVDPKVMVPVLAALGLPTGWLSSAPSESSSNNSSTRPLIEPSPNSEDSPTIKSSSSTTSREAPMG